ncbi:MAG: molecular chaperone GrpE [Actinomycetota bacterium]|nr:molecular chaperone GrpE [Actinomycetota bacterium]
MTGPDDVPAGDPRDPRETGDGPVIRDKRRIDPETGAVREPAGGSTWQPQPAPPQGQPGPVAGTAADPAAGTGDAAALDEALQQLAERTSDLQRVQAEYANYRRRVDRDRAANREQAVGSVLANLLPVLDDIGRAREHGELQGGFKSVGEALEQTVEKLGLTRFGEAGDAFDPTMHEALTHAHSAEVSEPTCVQVFQPGYRIGERIVRPARVAVADPE